MISESEVSKALSPVEAIKTNSRYLRGTIVEDFANTSTGGIKDENAQLTKFHGMYLQDDRDVRNERRRQKLEKAFSFMIRMRLPGGVINPAQYLTMDELADTRANGSIRLTTRQSIQLHGVLKGNMKPLIQSMNRVLMDSIAACGDVNRNVMCHPNPAASPAHARVFELAKEFSAQALPQSRAYHEIWLDGERVAGGEEEVEPIYGKTYLPRKFKTGFAIPPSNDIDVFSQDLGYIAIIEDGELAGFNVCVGGGLGMSHGNAATYPRLADVIGFVTPEQAIDAGIAVITAQRDYGDRTNRKHARLKYTIEDRGIEWFKNEVETRAGFKLAPARPYHFSDIADDYGWHQGTDGKWFLTLFILSGRIKDADGWRMKSALRAIAKDHQGDFRITPSQNLIVAGIDPDRKAGIEAILKEHGVDNTYAQSGLRLNALSCVALPTCGLALSESERVLPRFLERLEDVIDECGLRHDRISIRMTGCPNGCARPYLGEIGLVGRAPGKWNLYLGAKYDGTRLNKLIAQSLTEDKVIETLSPILRRYATERTEGEEFGDYCQRTVLQEAEAAFAAN